MLESMLRVREWLIVIIELAELGHLLKWIIRLLGFIIIVILLLLLRNVGIILWGVNLRRLFGNLLILLLLLLGWLIVVLLILIIRSAAIVLISRHICWSKSRSFRWRNISWGSIDKSLWFLLLLNRTRCLLLLLLHVLKWLNLLCYLFSIEL